VGTAGFEWFVAGRYLRARRKEKVVSVVTVISVIGVAAGVMALVIALAINSGFRDTLERGLLSATAHANIVTKEAGQGISGWREVAAKIRRVPHVVAVAPVLYDPGIVISGPLGTILIVLKGIDTQSELSTSDVLHHLKSGSLEGLATDQNGLPGIILGSKAALDAGLSWGSVVNVVNPQGGLTPFGPTTRSRRFRVAGIFESGFYDFDDHWAFATLGATQNLLSVGDVVNDIEIRTDDPANAPSVAKEAQRAAGAGYDSTNWQDQNRPLFSALKVESIVTFVTVGLIEIVAALNIFIALTMIVLTKYKDIAVLMSMGTRRAQIRRIFVMQGAIIGMVGTVIGLATGYSVCYLANTYRWIPLDAAIYAVSFVPFRPNPLDGLWIAALAMAVSLLATINPARNATRIAPVEVLRYE
jgi:lipoprotein-releasing system permease protein